MRGQVADCRALIREFVCSAERRRNPARPRHEYHINAKSWDDARRAIRKKHAKTNFSIRAMSVSPDPGPAGSLVVYLILPKRRERKR